MNWEKLYVMGVHFWVLNISGLLYFIFIERSFGFDVKLKVLITDHEEFYQHKLLKLLFGL